MILTPPFSYKEHEPIRSGDYRCSCGAFHFWSSTEKQWYLSREAMVKNKKNYIPRGDLYSFNWAGLTAGSYLKEMKKWEKRLGK